jgi:hypothetical protein
MDGLEPLERCLEPGETLEDIALLQRHARCRKLPVHFVCLQVPSPSAFDPPPFSIGKKCGILEKDFSQMSRLDANGRGDGCRFGKS